MDQVLYTDLKSSDSISALETQPIDETKPGLGQHYCVPCAKYFETASAKSHHQRGKVHKRRVKLIKEGPYTHEEADAAAGHNVAKFEKLREQGKSITEAEVTQQQLAKPPKEEEEEETKEEQEASKQDEMQIQEE